MRSSQVTRLGEWSEVLGRDDVARIKARAKRGGPFAYAVARPGLPPAFVLVAEDDAAMQALVKRFAALESVHAGVLTD